MNDCFDLPFLGKALSVSAAYSGRIAVAYKYGKSFKGRSSAESKNKTPDPRYVNLVVSIYECESTGGIDFNLLFIG